MRKTDYKEITGVIHCLSGMRIGGSDDLLQIGGTDPGSTCIRDPVTLKPYIPGSSIKGKMRSELEAKLDKFGGGGNEPCGCGESNCMVCVLFGPHKNTTHKLGPTRIIIRDAQLHSGGETERKSSTAIDRKTGAGLQRSLRTEERVVAHSEFKLKIGLAVWDRDENECRYNGQTGEAAMIEFIKEGLRLIERTGLGSGISKGSGEVEFRDLKLDGKSFELWHPMRHSVSR